MIFVQQLFIGELGHDNGHVLIILWPIPQTLSDSPFIANGNAYRNPVQSW